MQITCKRLHIVASVALSELYYMFCIILNDRKYEKTVNQLIDSEDTCRIFSGKAMVCFREDSFGAL